MNTIRIQYIEPARRKHSSDKYRGLFLPALALTAICATATAATPGIPFTEDFANDNAIDAAATTAARSAAKQVMQPVERSTWTQPTRYRAFTAPLNDPNGIPANIEARPARDIAIGDVNRDGFLDAVVTMANGSSNLQTYFNRVCLGDGAGKLGGSGSGDNCYTYDATGPLASNTNAVLLVDVNHDGYLDIIEGRSDISPATGGPDDARNRLVLGNGTVSFVAGTAIGSETDTTTDLAAGDFNRDGNVDLIVANVSQTNKLYLGDGAGGFSATGIDIGAETADTKSIAIGDLDRDGDLDLVTNDGALGTTKRVYLNDGSGGFSATGIDVGLDSDPTRAIALGDFTSDGVLDLALVNSNAVGRIYPGDGSGGFTDAGYTIPFIASGIDSLSVGDLDGDGNLDAVVGVGSNGSSRIFYGDGNGGMVADGTLDFTIMRTIQTALADLDNDGSLDIVAEQKLSTLAPDNGNPDQVYMNSPGTGFDPRGLDLIPNYQTYTNGLRFADLDGDGDLDVVSILLYGSDAVYINEFNGDFNKINGVKNAAFFSGPYYIPSSGTNTNSMDVGDVNGDGIPDLVTGDIAGTRKLFFGNGTGGFVYQRDLEAGAFDFTNAILFGDVDNDGDLDIVAADSNSSGHYNELFLNDGTGNFPASGTAIGSENDYTLALALGDVDGDGNPDLVVGNTSAYPNRLYLGDGAGGFSATGTAIGTSNYNTAAIALVDFDGDGHLDIIAGNRNSADRVYFNDGSGNFPGNGTPLAAHNGDTVDLLVGDVNNDAIVDIVAIESAATSVYLGDGSGGAHRSFLPSGGNTADSSGALGDLDRDGDLELLVGGFNEQDYIYFNEWDNGSFDDLAVPFGNGSDAARGAVVFDANGDYWPDLAVANDGQSNRLFLGSASGEFSGNGSAIGTEFDNSQAFVAGDFNGDGNADLAVANDGGQNRLYLGDGSGGFSAAGFGIGLDVDNSLGIAAGDINHDGNLDVAVANNGQSNKFYLGNGDGTFDNGADISADADGSASIALADVDLDGQLDALVGNSGQNKVYTGDGAGGFNAGVAVGSETDSTRAIAVGDINRDGKPDLAAGNDGQPNRYYLGNGDGTFSASGIDFGPETEATQALLLIDIGNDGDFDAVAGNLGGADRLYINNGFGEFGSVAISADAGANMTRGLAAGDTDRDSDLDLVMLNDGEPSRTLLQSGYQAQRNVVTSLKVNDAAQTGIEVLRLTATTRGENHNDYYLSNDGGASWHPVQSGVDFTFPGPGDDIRWKAVLNGKTRVVIPSLYAVKITGPGFGDPGGGSVGVSGNNDNSGGGSGGGSLAFAWMLILTAFSMPALARRRRKVKLSR